MPADTNFYYFDIGRELVSHFRDRLDRGESSVMLGPQGAGKRYVIDLVNDSLDREGREVLPIAEFESETLLSKEEHAVSLLTSALSLPQCETFEQWALLVRRKSEEDEQPIRIAAANVDGMNKALAHQFLTHVRTLVNQDRCLVIALTGESSLMDLVYGPNSAFQCVHQYVVHAHDHECFSGFVRKRLVALNLRATELVFDDLVSRLYSLTGGDVSLARAALWCYNDTLHHHNREPEAYPVAVDLDELPRNLLQEHIVPLSGLVPFRYGVHAIRSDLEAIKCMEALLANGQVAYRGHQPHSLELAGFARRDSEHSLVWFSEYARRFAGDYYTAVRIGDLFAVHQDWDRAFECYSQVSSDEEKRRPYSEEDEGELTAVLDALAVAFHRIVSEKTSVINARDDHSRTVLNRLRKLLVDSLRHLLGFENVTLWKRKGGRWIPARCGPDSEAVPDALICKWDKLQLESDQIGHEGGLHWLVCRDSLQRASSAVLLDGRDDPLAEHPARKAAIYRLLEAYLASRKLLAMNEGLKTRLANRKAAIELSSQFQLSLGQGDWESEVATAEMVERLAEQFPGISQAVCLSVEHNGDEIMISRVERHHSEQMGKTSLRSVQDVGELGKAIGTVLEGDACWIEARAAQLLLEPLGFRFGESDCLLFPWQAPEGKVLLLEQHADGLDEEVIDALNGLVDQFSLAVTLDNKLATLRESLDQTPNPVVLVGPTKDILFLNSPAVAALGMKEVRPGWQSTPVSWRSAGIPDDIAQRVLHGLDQKVRAVKALTDGMPGTWLIRTTRLRGSSGWFLSFHDRAFLFGTFDLMRHIERAESEQEALQAIAESIKKNLVAETAKLRIYMVDPDDRNALVSRYSLGFCNPKMEQLFNSGQVRVPRTDDSDGWSALEEKTPKFFRLLRDKESRDRVTDRGLVYRSVQSAELEKALEREEGDLWINLPLLDGDEKLGIVTLSFSSKEGKKLLPETGELFQSLSVVLGDLLARLIRANARKEQLRIDAEEALAQSAHNLVNQISALNGFINRYRLRERSSPKLKEINDDLEEFYTHATKSLRRITDRVGPVNLKPTRCDLVAVIGKALDTVLHEEDCWNWERGAEKSIPGKWDSTAWENVFIEIAHNSRDFRRPDVDLRVNMDVRLERIDSQDRILLVYCDNGRGVPEQIKERIFTGESHRECLGRSGNGIGLNYARRVLEAHGGKIIECGVENQGAEFRISFPLDHHEEPATNTNLAFAT